MGKKRRHMFNKKFQKKHEGRWEMGRSKLQKKLQETGQIKEDNSVMIEKLKKEAPDLKEEKVETPPPPSVTNLTKMKKSELLDIAQSMNCDVSSKNTKSQIIAAIEKQSA